MRTPTWYSTSSASTRRSDPRGGAPRHATPSRRPAHAMTGRTPSPASPASAERADPKLALVQLHQRFPSGSGGCRGADGVHVSFERAPPPTSARASPTSSASWSVAPTGPASEQRISLAVAALRWLAAHPWIVAAVLLVAAVGVGAWAWRRREAARWDQVRASGLRYALGKLDGLHHRAFEFAVRDLMRRDGCTDAQQVGGLGDNGADVKATDPFGRRWVIQCKRRKDGWSGKPVGTPDLQVLNGTGRPHHRQRRRLREVPAPPSGRPPLPRRMGRPDPALCANSCERFPRPAAGRLPGQSASVVDGFMHPRSFGPLHAELVPRSAGMVRMRRRGRARIRPTGSVAAGRQDLPGPVLRPVLSCTRADAALRGRRTETPCTAPRTTSHATTSGDP
ncbi:restriction endonuclease [Streptomyces virginiae]|uniref:restriction endonuclease n=1 Tax=Streptomyces virginiae TaxID=1961 RepID=UPI0036A2E436